MYICLLPRANPETASICFFQTSQPSSEQFILHQKTGFVNHTTQKTDPSALSVLVIPAKAGIQAKYLQTINIIITVETS